jgi:hypothetical protein
MGSLEADDPTHGDLLDDPAIARRVAREAARRRARRHEPPEP